MQHRTYTTSRTGGNGGRMRARVSPSMTIACLALFFSLTGAGFAAQHYLITSKQQIAPWVRHALRGDRGPQGLAGHQGARGPQGATGQAGPQGPAGASGTAARPFIFHSDVTLQPEEQKSITVACPAGNDGAAAGGFTVPDGVRVLENRPLGQNVGPPYDEASGWIVAAVNGSGSPADVTVWAACMF